MIYLLMIYYTGEEVYKIIDPEDPKVQAEVAEKRELFKETSKWLQEIYDKEGPAATEAEAIAKSVNEAADAALS